MRASLTVRRIIMKGMVLNVLTVNDLLLAKFYRLERIIIFIPLVLVVVNVEIRSEMARRCIYKEPLSGILAVVLDLERVVLSLTLMILRVLSMDLMGCHPL
jgi:hypothetical protein